MNITMINLHANKIINKWIGIFLSACLITGCQDYSTDLGQQYLDGDLPLALNLSVSPTKIPINIEDYLKQIEILKQVSPSLYKKNQSVYLAIEQWIDGSFSAQEFNRLGLSRYQLPGEDNQGNVNLTGYYTPVLKARHTLDAEFRYPLYAKPSHWQGVLPTRGEIYDGAFDGHNLAIAYTRTLIDNFIMEVQGSGYLDFETGESLVFFGYNGKNGHPYQSIGRLLIEQGEIEQDKISMQAIKEWAKHQDEFTVMNLLKQNASAVFFKPQIGAKVVGSAGVPLIEKASVASDPSIIPTGSVMLIDVPLLDENGIYQGEREWRLMVALDIGGAIKGQHLDMYQGIGDEAGEQAGFYHHYGRVWLIKPSFVDTVDSKLNAN